jgi:general nucleoside transport system permease protein
MEINWLLFVDDWLAASLRLAAPLILVGIGGVFTERTGIFNIGMEGMMLTGTFFAIAGTLATGNVWMGTLWAIVAGGIMGLIHAFLTVTRRANQIVSGAAINLFALGFTNLLNPLLYQAFEYRPRVPLFPSISPDFLKNLPFIGNVFFSQPIIVWIALVLPFLAAWILNHTSWGLSIRAVGDHPHAVATAGISVIKLKYIGVLLSGFFSGLGGAALVLSQIGLFAPNITGGRGFIVLAALVVGKWNPILVAAACLLFGAADAFQFRLQTFDTGIPYQLPIMIPYILTVAALAGLVGRTVPPKTAGQPYDPESH